MIKQFTSLFSLLTTMLLLLSCNTTAEKLYLFNVSSPFFTQAYSGKNSIHPVIVKVFEQNKIHPKSIDIINNEYHSDYIYQSNFGAKIRYTVYVKLGGDTIKVQLQNIQQFNFKKSQWFNENRLSFFDVEKLPTKIASDIIKILNNQERYNKVKTEVYNNFLFHYLVIKNLPKSNAQNWIKTQMLTHTFNLDVKLSKFESNKKNALSNKKYSVEFTNNSASYFNDNFVIMYFTNNAKYSKINASTSLHISGKLLQSSNIATSLINASHAYLTE